MSRFDCSGLIRTDLVEPGSIESGSIESGLIESGLIWRERRIVSRDRISTGGRGCMRAQLSRFFLVIPAKAGIQGFTQA
ncbi:hypothetical protein [Lysobacter capsici]|uniref:hypothetical protein n=1 Tax=Lysobacter capsici TaxID=435897 RepID=UPI00398D2FD7